MPLESPSLPDGAARFTIVVYAPFGTDPLLSTYNGRPEGVCTDVQTHPLYLSLRTVSERGVNVCAYIDRQDDYTWYMEGVGVAGSRPRLVRAGKQSMDDPRALADLLLRARAAFPGTQLVLAIEGHGAGFLPHLNMAELTPEACRDGGELGTLDWRTEPDGAAVPHDQDGNPILGMGSPLLPVGSPLAPHNHYPLSTFGLGDALRMGLENDRLAVLHLDNCFNMSIEVLDTIAPFAQYATGYANYNFFTAGLAYPAVFGTAGRTLSARDLAKRFARGNRAALRSGRPGSDRPTNGHPTTGTVVDLGRMRAVRATFTAMSESLFRALNRFDVRSPSERAQHMAVVGSIQKALASAQHYDTSNPMSLDQHDELVDVMSMARHLQKATIPGDTAGNVARGAEALAAALEASVVEAYGEVDHPRCVDEEGVIWDFTRQKFGINVLCPDPMLQKLWDWRSAFYLQDGTLTAAQPKRIGFMVETRWRDFIVAYHKHLEQVRLPTRIRPAAIPIFPTCKSANWQVLL